MNIEAFLRHHRMASNPFRGEEARQDAVFDRVEADCGSGTKNPPPVNPAIRFRMARSASATAAITSAG